MTDKDDEDLKRLKNSIKDHFAQQIALGRSLAKIRDGRLYRETHESFDDFVRDEFGISPSEAKMLISDAQEAN